MTPRTYETSVFLNCPFDHAYQPLFEAVVFAVYDCGFVPRCALEVDDGSQVRIEKIIRIIGSCRLSVHDVSRTETDTESGLPRFNMPLELGIFLGAKAFGPRRQRRKAAIILDGERYRFQRFISDIAGQDIRAHSGLAREAVCRVRDFLSIHLAPVGSLPGGEYIAARFELFAEDLPRACSRARLHRDNLTFLDLTNLVVGWIRDHPKAATLTSRRAATPAPAAPPGGRGTARRGARDRRPPAPRR